MNEFYANLIRNMRVIALEASQQLGEAIKSGVEINKVQLDAIKYTMNFVTTKDAMQVPERSLEEHDLGVQKQLLKSALAEVEALEADQRPKVNFDDFIPRK